MHSLLKRQIKKFLPDDLKNHPGMDSFFESICKSYSDYDEKLKMIQRATSLSSTELYKANKRLNAETESQQKVLDALGKAVAFMQSKSNSKQNGHVAFDPHKFVENIENQTNKIVEITAEKDLLLNNLEQQNESLNNYAHMVSHDLKSPIRNIHSLVSWVFEDGCDDFKNQSRDSFELIFQNLGKMDSLIDGILKHATIDTAEEKLTNVDLNHLIEEIDRTIFVPEFITIKVEGKLPVLYTDKYRIEQLFKNLLTNAVSATEGNIEGRINISAQQDEEGWLFSIADNGKGIPKHLQAGIFDMFKKLENDANATGIGLALVKKLINYYKGDIWLSSEEGRGTTFFFTLKSNI
ncbi:MAG: HAMP domain-containing histidine kinase [Croceitalea sp.]|nr:HAMP domain-containing histidine kinase [Croceitalea sp.]MBT8238158.1 HAMP domain-containing histidine kinase [Croceitalea sp.]NNC33632.1 HAMP domain-containing histidine kinase [Croceitalea sp.]NNL09390.1 HAMP domain-containing histidine kinase [Croceitalea sp.]NNM17468.1 HAMP domain-containing histidine kinase [Croceitalea sp.]